MANLHDDFATIVDTKTLLRLSAVLRFGRRWRRKLERCYTPNEVWEADLSRYEGDLKRYSSGRRFGLIVANTQSRLLAYRLMSNDLLVNDPAKFPAAFDHALDSGDLDQLLRLYDPEACVHKSDGSVGLGLEHVSEESRKLIGAKAQLHNQLRCVYRSGQTALIIVDWTLELNTPDGKRTTSKGTATNVIRHTPEHGWRMLIANPQGIAQTP